MEKVTGEMMSKFKKILKKISKALAIIVPMLKKVKGIPVWVYTVLAILGAIIYVLLQVL